MKIFKDFLDKKELLKELKLYRETIRKRLEIEDFNSALNKTRSALTLIKEYREKFDLKKEIEHFSNLNEDITTKLDHFRRIYFNRLHKLLKQKINEENLDKLMKLLASLRREVDKKYELYNLHDVQDSINTYFTLIKQLYVIISSYRQINYHEVSENIFNFRKELENVDFPNLDELVEDIYQKLIIREISKISKKREKISLEALSDVLEMRREDLLEVILVIMKRANSPIKVYNSTTQELVFK